MFQKEEKKSFFDKVIQCASDNTFRVNLQNLLISMCQVNTVPNLNTMKTAEAERKVYTLIKETLSKYALEGSFVDHLISNDIRHQKEYTPPYYQDGDDYGSRYNLLHIYNPNLGNPGIALNAHIDVVPPYFPPKEEGSKIIGRGASDDKGCCVTIIGALILLKEIERIFGITPTCPVISMFVTDEESGGNGSLSLALDTKLAELYKTIIVCESTEGKLHPANRGALWFRVEILEGKPKDQLELMFQIVRRFESIGKNLRANSIHPLFPTRPVQTCEGILGSYGEHPARTCNMVALELKKNQIHRNELIDTIENGLSKYISVYTDRTKHINPTTHKPKILSHYSLKESEKSFILEVYGTSIHMGKALEYDSAIVKAAWLTQPLYQLKPALEISLYNHSEPYLILEGGQGFLPTHSIDEVKKLLTSAITFCYNSFCTNTAQLSSPTISFNKLHNDAYECNPSSSSMKAMIEIAKELGIKDIEPIEGFPVSCDARIFANRYPNKEVITCGPGTISFAHTDNEQISIEEISLGAVQLALSILNMSGAIKAEDLNKVFTNE